MEKNEKNKRLNHIIYQLYQAENLLHDNCTHFFNVKNALIQTDNCFELLIKLFLSHEKYYDFYRDINILRKGFPKLLNFSQVSIITSAHKLRNKLYHEIKKIEYSENDIKEYFSLIKDYIWIIQKLISKMYNRNFNCLFFDEEMKNKIVGKFVDQWFKTKQLLYEFYDRESDIIYPNNPFKASVELAAYQGIINSSDINILEIIYDFFGDLFKGNTKNLSRIQEYDIYLENLNKKVKQEIIYYFNNYDQRLR